LQNGQTVIEREVNIGFTNYTDESTHSDCPVSVIPPATR
jgi:hypothetical protein